MKVLNDKLENHTNFKVGGSANIYVIESRADIESLPDEVIKKAHVLGGGTNLLVTSDDLKTPVIKLENRHIEADYNAEDSVDVTISAGMPMEDVVDLTIALGLGGLVGMAGIPGTLGGALFMNAGATHGAVSDNLIEILALDRKTREWVLLPKAACLFSFRSSIFHTGKYIIFSARFKLPYQDRNELLDIKKKIVSTREAAYPLSFPSAGCVFKRDWGGKDVIQKLGLSGYRVGGAVVSPLLPAFIINVGGATSHDILSLIKEIQDRAKEIGEEMPCEIDIWKQ